MSEQATIRYREVIATKPAYGRFGEYQVVLGRKIIFRGDFRDQAERWAKDHGYSVPSHDQTTTENKGDIS